MSFLSILATMFGLGEGIFSLPQAYKIFKRKSAKDISIITYSFLLTSVVVWFLYGLEISNRPILISNIFAMISLVLIIIGWFIYGKEQKSKK